MVLTRRSATGGRWTNWAGNQIALPAELARPESESELVAVIRRAGAQGLRVKVVGAGHSFTAIALTDGVQISLDRYRRIVTADVDSGLVTVQAGMTLRQLSDALAPLGLALANLGDISSQTIAGAIATGTHGTGRQLGGLATQIAGLRLVLADGSVLTCSATEEPSLFAAARVGLGALGVISTVTVQCVAAFTLRAVERARRWPDVLAELDELVDGNEHFEFYWFPHTDGCQTKENNRADAPRALGPVRSFLQDDLLANAAFGTICHVGRRVPAAIPALNRFGVRALGVRTYADRSDKVFTSPRRVRFCEMEYALPRSELRAVLERVRAYVDGSGLRISFPIEVRVSAADDIWMSTAYGRDSAYIAAHTFRGTPYEDYFGGIEAILDEVGGRPHWGKLHFQTAATLRPRYPHFDDFVTVRDKLDPDRRFANGYLDRVLGP